MRDLIRLGLLFTMLWLGPSVVRADVAPAPGRPEWEQTPMPMPQEPPTLALVIAAVVTLAAWRVASRAEP